MADSMITESAQNDNLRAATPVKRSPEQNVEIINETFATYSRSKIDGMNDKEQQPLESSEKSSKPKDINSADKSELMESRDATPMKSRSNRKTNVRRNSESDDEGMEQHNKGSSKMGKSPNDQKTRTDGSNETPKKRLREDPIVTPRKRPKNGSKESSEEKSGGHSRDRSRRKSRSRSRDRSREDSRDTPRKHHRKRSRERSKERSGKHSDEKSGERRERSRDGHRSKSKSPWKEKVIKSHGNNSSHSLQKSQETSNSTAVKKTQTNKNNITYFFKKEDEKKTRISPILFDEPKTTEASRSRRKEDSLKLLKQDWKLDKKENFHFFFGKDDPFSNFYPARFTVNGETYTCSEQFMMHQKAMLFQDRFHAAAIMKAKVPLQMKRLGRKVQNFNAHVWGVECDKIMKRGLRAKFTENEHMKMELIKTFPRILVEASPRDRLWGIGLGGKNAKAHCRLTWQGKNKLGYLLTYIRNEIMEEEGLFH